MPQADQHVRTWTASLKLSERLEYRAWLRRCFLGKGTWSWRDGDPGSQAGLDKLEAAKQKKFTGKV